MNDAAFFHSFSPVAIDLGFFAVRWYGLSYVLGFVLSYLVLRVLARRGLIALPADRVADAMVYIIFGVLIGGRVGYAVLGYDPALLWTFSDSLPYWNLLAINKGGMSSHGGMIGVIIASWLISRGFKGDSGEREGACEMLHICDVLALCAPIGFFFGRIANFINGELLGKIIAPPGQPAPWYAVRFPQELLGWSTSATPSKHTPPLTPEQHTELVRLVYGTQRPGDSWSLMLDRIVGSPARFKHQLEPLLAARHPSQLYAALLEGLAVAILVWLLAARPRRSGIVGSWWLIGYGLARIIGEVWRLPDAQFDVDRPWGLSRGQWFSVVMVLVGGVALVVLSARPGPHRLGWRAASQ